MKAMTYILLFCIMGCACARIPAVDNTPVEGIDLVRYLGHWYEIAKFDHPFERGVEYATAQYILNDNGTIKVLNSGIRNGEFTQSEGKAKITGTPGLLRVSFFGPFYGDYRILMLGPDYSYALVGGSNGKYLWILSRTPVLPGHTRELILDEARRRNYPVENLRWVPQEDMISDGMNDADTVDEQ